ncbi:TlpA family protein disulfide reductase [Sphingomonas beigongshangi]|uniref:TlpA family protein disulfide reductase n=1 Tax=Sphingomonas beigongshangi TaxID=2782540 RepID=UPI001AEF0913|nr:TlpA disulfide reductase family protein [Sphingomonas beigongshangi]
MSPSPFARVAMVGLLALAIGGCDRQSAGNAQGDATAINASAPSPDEAAPAAGAAGAAAAATGIDRSHSGEAAPTASFTGPDGKQTSLAAFRGRPVLVNLWATWCGPCVAELPTLGKLAGSGTVRVAAISQDMQATDKVPAFLQAHGGAALTPYVDKAMALSLGYGANLPMTVLFDSTGKEVWRWRGGNDWTGAAAKALIAEAK